MDFENSYFTSNAVHIFLEAEKIHLIDVCFVYNVHSPIHGEATVLNIGCPTRYRTRLAGGPLLRVATIRRTTDTHYRHTLQTHSFSFLTQRTYSCSNFVAIS